MKNNTAITLCALGAILISFSPSIAFVIMKSLYSNMNLTGEYPELLAGFITAYRWLGAFMVGAGFLAYLKRIK